MMNRELNSRFLDGLFHLVQFLYGEGHRLLAQNVLGCLGGFNHRFFVQVVGNGNDHGIHIWVTKKVIHMLVFCNSRCLGVLHLFRFDITQSHQLNFLEIREKILQLVPYKTKT